MYAIVEIGGGQYKVSQDDHIEVERLKAKKEGDSFEIEKVLLINDGKNVAIGRPFLKEGVVVCEVEAHLKGKKVIAYKYRKTKSSKWKKGHRQQLTRLLVKEIKHRIKN